MSFISAALIRDVLMKYGELAWNRASPIDLESPILKYNVPNSRSTPHFTAWRYKTPDSYIEDAIIEAVKSFIGNVEWDIYVKMEGNRNWVIEPKKVGDYKKAGKVLDYSAVDYLEKYEPEFGELANQDVPALAAHLDQTLQKALERREQG